MTAADTSAIGLFAGTRAPGWLTRYDPNELDARLASRFMRESWKYTSLKRFTRAAGAHDPGAPGGEPPIVSGAEIVPLADHPGWAGRLWARTIDTDRFPLAAYVAARQGPGWLVRVDEDLDATVTWSRRSAPFGTLLIDVAVGGRLTFTDTRVDGGLACSVVGIAVGRNAEVRHHQAASGSTACQWRLTSIHLDRDSRYEANAYATGSELRRLDTHIRLAGAGAALDLLGAISVAGGEHLDQQIVVEHLTGNTTSRQRIGGIANGKGSLTFNGRIHIHSGARQSDAGLINHNIALAPGCEINTKPELEIYNDDVRCAHGATVGKLSEDASFYLQSRGIPRESARRLLIQGFLNGHARGPLSEFATSLLERNS